jgi:hypothetical protein
MIMIIVTPPFELLRRIQKVSASPLRRYGISLFFFLLIHHHNHHHRHHHPSCPKAETTYDYHFIKGVCCLAQHWEALEQDKRP